MKRIVVVRLTSGQHQALVDLVERRIVRRAVDASGEPIDGRYVTQLRRAWVRLMEARDR